jgi:hypothetical protein
MDDCIPFKKQDIPHTLWMYFNLVVRCNVWILPDFSLISCTFPSLDADDEDDIVNQLMYCSFLSNCRQF